MKAIVYPPQVIGYVSWADPGPDNLCPLVVNTGDCTGIDVEIAQSAKSIVYRAHVVRNAGNFSNLQILWMGAC